MYPYAMDILNFTSFIGKKIGHRTIIEGACRKCGENWENGFICRCDCGDISFVKKNPLLNGRADKCKKCSKIFNRKKKIPDKNTERPEYTTWSGMISRCKNKNDKNYGGRGIKVCKEWRKSFQAFFDYIGKKPSPDHSIDRINVDGNYEPGNVRWATSKEQANNKRS